MSLLPGYVLRLADTRAMSRFVTHVINFQLLIGLRLLQVHGNSFCQDKPHYIIHVHVSYS